METANRSQNQRPTIRQRSNAPLSDGDLQHIAQRARWLTTSEREARRDDGQMMLALLNEIRILRERLAKEKER